MNDPIAQQLVAMTLFGGVADGADVEARLLPRGELYLVRVDRGNGVSDVLVYGFANRTNRSGRWVLEFVRWVGFQGIPRKEGEG